MLITKEVQVTWNAGNKEWYIGRGYVFTKMGDKIIAKTIDLNPTGNATVEVICDYCGKKLPKKFMHYLDAHKTIQKDCCNDVECMKKKREEIFMKKYGIKTPLQDVEFLNKTQQTNIKKYGGITPSSSKKVLQKMKDTMLSKYGVENASQSVEFRMKKIRTMYKNGTQRSSTQQNYLHKLLGGEFNYPILGYLADIAFLDTKIIIEYNGSGHDLSIKQGRVTNEDFNKRELRRREKLINEGWKIITIIAKKDKLPSDDRIKNMILYAKDYFLSGHDWIEFYIDYRAVRCSQYIKGYSMGRVLYKVNK